ncbi:MAG: PAS domain-containing sensor histidine kinase [Chloroflexota bacterium]
MGSLAEGERLVVLLRQRWLGLAWAATAAYVVWALLPWGTALRASTTSVLTLAARAAASAAALSAARSLSQVPLRKAWNYLGIGLGFWALAEVLAALRWLGGWWPAPIPSQGDFLALAGYLALIAALGGSPSAPPERFGRLRGLLDVAILALAVIGLCWMVLLRPAMDIPLGNLVRVSWAASRSVLDLILAALAARLLLQASVRPAHVMARLLVSAFLVLAAVDLVYGYRLLFGDFRPGGALDAGWMAASLLLVGAALTAGRELPGVEASEGARGRTAARLEPLLAIALTYAVVGYTVLDWRFNGRVDWVGVTLSSILTLLLFARQGAIAGQVEMRQFAAVVNASTDLTFICHPDGQLRLANPALRQAIGVSSVEERSLHLQDVLARDVPTARLLGEALTQGWAGEVSFRRRDGSTFPVSLSLTPVQDERRARPMLVGTANDLTSVKEREVELRSALAEVAAARRDLEALNQALERKVEERTHELEQIVADLERLNEELTALDRLKSEFVALVSHELRAPLTNIRSGVELILSAYPEVGQAARRALELVHDETDRLGRFVEAILDLSALEAGKFPLRLAPLDVAEVAGLVCTRFPESLAARLRLAIPDGLPPVMADERALTSVLFHLLDNARKYAPSGEIRIEAMNQGTTVAVSVSDSGPGIPAEERERVFEMFHRLDARDSREVYGHGLGLHLAQRLVMAMQGGIRAEESPEGGARLTFWLPRADG